MDKTKDIKDLYAQWAPKYDESFNSVAVLVEEDELIKIIDPKDNERILDIGCGTGRLTEQVYKFTQNIVGTDLSPEMLEIAKRKLPGVTFVESNVEKEIPFDKESFDKVISSLVFQFIQNIQTPINEIFRVLKQGGKAYITTFVSDAPLEWSDIEYKLKSEKPIPSGSVQKISSFRKLDEFLSAAKDVGFTSISFQPLIVNQKVKDTVTPDSWEKIKDKWASVVLIFEK